MASKKQGKLKQESQQKQSRGATGLVGRPVVASKVIMTELVLPQHTNALGSVFGGVIVSWMDIAAAIAAQRHCGASVVTASIDSMQFVAPVYKGWVVNLKASVNYTGRTSMEVGIRVDAENPRSGEMFHTASAYFSFVAVDEKLRPIPVPPVVPVTDEDLRRHKAAVRRRQLRLRSREK